MNEKGRKPAIVVTVLTAFIMPFMGSALNLSVPGIGQEFGVSASFVGWMITSYMLTAAALNVPFGKLADITSRKSVLVTGIIVLTAGCIGAVFAWSMISLLVCRVIQGIGGAMVTSCNIPILISFYPPQMRGKALGMAIGSVYIGGAMGPVIGGTLNHQLGWRSIFIFACIITAVALVIAVTKLPHDKAEGRKRKMDYGGSALFVVFISLFMLGLSKIEGGMIPITLTALGVALGFLFVYYALHKSDPVIDVHLFANNIGYTMSNLAALLNYAATSAISYLISIYLQVVMGYTSQTAGLIMIAQPLIMAVLTPKMGKLSDRYSPFKLSSIGMGLCAAGTILFMFIGRDTGLPYIICALAVTGVGFAFFSSPNTNAILSCVDKRDYSAANAMVGTMRSIGQTSSMVIVTIVITFLMPGLQLTQAEPDQLIHVIRISFIVFACLCIIGIFLSLLRKKEKVETSTAR